MIQEPVAQADVENYALNENMSPADAQLERESPVADTSDVYEPAQNFIQENPFKGNPALALPVRKASKRSKATKKSPAFANLKAFFGMKPEAERTSAPGALAPAIAPKPRRVSAPKAFAPVALAPPRSPALAAAVRQSPPAAPEAPDFPAPGEFDAPEAFDAPDQDQESPKVQRNFNLRVRVPKKVVVSPPKATKKNATKKNATEKQNIGITQHLANALQRPRRANTKYAGGKRR
jgi:hypothetical protein